MTAQEKLHAVETAIRKALPRLMELREGVILKRKGHFELYYDYVILKIKEDDFSTYTEIDGNRKSSFSIETEKLLDYFEILGHDIMLSDVLEWLGDRFGHLYSTDSYGNLYEETDFSKVKVAHINLSKPRLADQSEKLWAFLYNLIKED